MNAESQDEVVDFLAHILGDARNVRTTHISIVVLGEDRVFKLKRDVVFPYLDFSTPEKRLALCQREVALNRRLAPALYLGARRVTREPGGSLALDGAGDLVDAVVEMRRFDEDTLFERLAQTKHLTREMIEKLASRLAAFHAATPADASRGGLAEMKHVVALSDESLRQAAFADEKERQTRRAALDAALTANGALLERRRAQGKVRLCHGDLTLRNICLYEGESTPFDCLEFSDELATVDVLYDLGFLLMDLWKAQACDLANLTLNRYLDASDETDGLPLLPFFMAMRATIRSHVNAAQKRQDDATAYYDLAGTLLRENAPRLIAIGGLSGTGKSTVAAALAPRIGRPPGARVLNSDRLRKQAFGVSPTARLPPEAYSSAVSARVYERMFQEAALVAHMGWSVVVDAVFDRAEDRLAIENIASACNIHFVGLWLELALEDRLARVDGRHNDVSDATRDVALAQAQRDCGQIDWLRLDAARDISAIVADIDEQAALKSSC
jgi:uncharacterized protein